jgi:hypothetical protein
MVAHTVAAPPPAASAAARPRPHRRPRPPRRRGSTAAPQHTGAPARPLLNNRMPGKQRREKGEKLSRLQSKIAKQVPYASALPGRLVRSTRLTYAVCAVPGVITALRACCR